MKKVLTIVLTICTIALNAQNKGKEKTNENSLYPGYEKSENGLYFKFYKRVVDVKPKEGDVVRVVMSYKTSKDSVIFNSQNGNPGGVNFVEFPLPKSTFKGSFEDALSMMSLGDSASFLINADSIYLKTFHQEELPKYIEKGSFLKFEAKLEKITSKEEAEKDRNKKIEEENKLKEERKIAEPQEIAKYIADNKIKVKPTASGLYYIETSKGKGSKPTKGCNVKVNYTGRFLDGKIFDTSDEVIAKQAGLYDEKRPYGPIEIPIGVGQVIAGWDEGIMLMSLGAKGQLIIPSAIGYGAGAGPIPSFSTMVFDVELVSFTTATTEMNKKEEHH